MCIKMGVERLSTPKTVFLIDIELIKLYNKRVKENKGVVDLNCIKLFKLRLSTH